MLSIEYQICSVKQFPKQHTVFLKYVLYANTDIAHTTNLTLHRVLQSIKSPGYCT